MNNKFWWNYKKKCYELLEQPPTLDKDILNYLPNDHLAENIYIKLRKNGYISTEAMKVVLQLY